jgi:serine/threonine-protein kinase
MQAQEFFDYLKGDGYLEFHVDEKEVHVDIQRYEIIGRRLVLGKKNILGVSPLERIRLEHGSYMLTLSKSGFENVQYPVFIERSAVWDTRHPHTGKSIQMLSKGRLQSGSCYVPGSWFLMGGDPDCASSLARKRCWLDSFVIQKFPVTNAEYLCYLNTLVARDKYEESLALVPRERSGKAGELGPMIYGFEKDKGYFLCPDADGDVWEEEYPVCFLDWGMAKDYADFQALETAMRWRLPVELEWEKAARGVDGRFFPWGFYLEPSWACVREAAKGRPLPSVVDSFLIDESPYGVRGMAGNMCDWTASVHKKLGSKIDEKGVVVQESEAKSSDYLSYRGGGWSTQARHARVTDRGAAFGSALGGNLSFRLVSSI